MHQETKNFLFNISVTLLAFVIAITIGHIIVDHIIGEFPTCMGNCTIKTIW